MNAFRAALVLGLALLAAPAAAQERIEFGPFYYRADTPDRLYLDGPLELGSLQALLDASQYLSGADTLVLNSPGGTLVEALALAELVQTSSLNTVVPAGAWCLGSCFFVFMAGIERSAIGQLSVSGEIDNVALSYFSSGVMREITTEVLRRHGATEDLLRLLRILAGSGTHTFTPTEIASYGLNRSLNLNPTPFRRIRPVLEMEPPPVEVIGDLADGVVLREANAAEIEEQPAVTRWHRSRSPDPPYVATITFSADNWLVVFTGFGLAPSGDDGLFGGFITVHVFSNDSAVQRVSSVRLGQAGGPSQPVYFVSFASSIEVPPFEGRHVSSFVLNIPTIYVAATLASYSARSAFGIFLEFEDGTRGGAVFAVLDEVHHAFEDMMAVWSH